MRLVHAPVWVLFKNIPPELWSLVGFSTIASGIRHPVHSEFSKISPYTNKITKLKIVFVRITDRLGNSALIEASYPKLPPRCSFCIEFGHLQLRCPEARALANPTPVHVPPTSLPLTQAPPPIPSIVMGRAEDSVALL